jgi:leader peptidase (prepilin peptidase)/N-methyltransferase
VSVVDLRLFRIPDRIVFPALGLTFVLVVTASFVLAPTNSIAVDAIKCALLGMITYFAILFVFHIAYPRGMGFGDVKLALLMGFSLGWVGGTNSNAVYLVFVALFLGCVFGIVFGLGMRLIKGKGGAFPFGPALALACCYVILDAQRYLVQT